MTVNHFCELSATLTRPKGKLQEFARRGPAMAKSEEDDKTDFTKPAAIAGATAVAGLGTYGLLRRRTPLPSSASGKLMKIRAAAEAGGFARVHVDPKMSRTQKFIREVLQPADTHVHVPQGSSYTPGEKFKGAVFDPEDTERLAGKAMVGAENRTARSINRSKLHEYKEALGAGLDMPHTAALGAPHTLPKDYIAKFNTGARSQGVVTRDMIKNFDPKKPELLAFKKFHKGVASKIKDVDKRSIATTAHPGYKDWMTEQAITRPQDFVRQKKVDITDEIRVHTLDGKSLGISSGRYGASSRSVQRDARLAAEVKLQNVHPRLRENMLALDMARDAKGNWHVIETNPGPASGFLTPSRPDPRGPYQLYKRVTGRHAKPLAVAAGTGAAAAAGLGTAGTFEALDKFRAQESTPPRRRR
jgi:hypothetical protein